MLYVFSGLPGTGKSTLARQLARQLKAVYLRVDSVEAALLNAMNQSVTVEGYAAAYAVAADNLKLGFPVVVDCVNPIAVTREAWADTAAACAAPLVNIEVICSDLAEHQRRVELRHEDKLNHEGQWQPPTWAQVQDTADFYQDWQIPRTVLDTAQGSPQENFRALLSRLPDA